MTSSTNRSFFRSDAVTIGRCVLVSLFCYTAVGAQTATPAGTVTPGESPEETRLLEAVSSGTSANLGNSLERLGDWYLEKSRMAEAEATYRRLLGVVEAESVADAPRRARVLVKLGDLETRRGHGDVAETHLKAALAAYQTAGQGDSYPAAVAANRLGLIHLAAGRLPEAEAMFRAAAAGIARAVGKDHRSYGNVLNNLADALGREHRPAEAAAVLEEVITIFHCGPETAEYGLLVNNLGCELFAAGDLAGARTRFSEALTVLTRQLGPDDASIAACRGNLARLDLAEGRYPEAIDAYQAALNDRKRARTPDVPAVFQTLTNLGAAYLMAGKFGQAEDTLRAALRDYKPAVPNSTLASCLNNLGETSHAKGKYGPAEKLYREALAILTTTEGKNSPEYRTVLGNLGLLYEETNRLGESLDIAREIARLGGPPLPQTTSSTWTVSVGDLRRSKK